MAAAFGIAPNSPRLQRGANLSQLHSPSTGSGPVAVVPPHGIAPRSIGYRPIALLLSYRGIEMVARRGNAPRSAGCKPAALLLSYRAKKKMPPQRGLAPRRPA